MADAARRLDSLPPLPLPFYSQKYVVVSHKPAALKCRQEHPEWIQNPEQLITTFVEALGEKKPEWRVSRYAHVLDGRKFEVIRCRVHLPTEPPFIAIGDAEYTESTSRADKVAALQAILYLCENNLINSEGLPVVSRHHHERSDSGARIASPSSDSSSGSSSGSGSSSSSSSGSRSNRGGQGEPVSSSRNIKPLPNRHDLSPSINHSEHPASNNSQEGRNEISSFALRLEIASEMDRVKAPLPKRSVTQTVQDLMPAAQYTGRDIPRTPEPCRRSQSDTNGKPVEHSVRHKDVQSPPANGQYLSRTAQIVNLTQESNSYENEDSSTSSGSYRSPSPLADQQDFVEPSTVHALPQAPAAATVPAAPVKATTPQTIASGPGRHEIKLEAARGFIDFYCRKFNYGRPDLAYRSKKTGGTEMWEAVMTIKARSVGQGVGCNKKEATSLAYIDSCMWMAGCDPEMWKTYQWEEGARKDSDARTTMLLKHFPKADLVPSVELKFSDKLDAQIRDFAWAARESELYQTALKSRARAQAEVLRYRKERAMGKQHSGESRAKNGNSGFYASDDSIKNDALFRKSRELRERQDDYRSNPRHAQMRKDRASLPVSSYTDKLLQEIEDNPVIVVMAQTGSGKTTQIPQIILDDYISKGNGALCNIVCTQPRRLAAISVAERIAEERGEPLGKTVGYHVRFENSFPERDGSILFMTTGIFLRRMQVGLENISSGQSDFLDEISHIVVDEVHERDIDVDLLLFVVRRQLAERRKAGKSLFKVILMSATIDPSLFCNYFKNPQTGKPALFLEIPGRSYPVEKHYLDELCTSLSHHPMYQSVRWVFDDKDVKPYLDRELQNPLEHSAAIRTDDELRFPAPLVALMIAFVARRTLSTRDGHILVFLPGLDEIKAVMKVLENSSQPLLNMNFNDYEMHILHSAVPAADQRLVFKPAPRGRQRIILSTNLAETSLTIPDVVYVVDAGKCKEKRFDPERHLSSLVQAFTGTSNMQQRAGRAGRHRPGEYYSIVSESRMACLPQNQTVEMKRLDLSSVVMHVKGLNLPMEVENVLDDCIEPPGHERVIAAINMLERVGALDMNKNLTSLGNVLLHLPVEAAIGKFCLLGCFFRCLDQVLAIAAIMTNRDPFVAPLEKRQQANSARRRFCPPGFKSDILTVLKAYNEWSSLPSYYDRRQFCEENFLSNATLQIIEKLRTSLIQSLDRAGVLSLAAGGARMELIKNRDGQIVLPHFLNTNGECLPLLTALISCAQAPGFAVRKSTSLLRTPQDSAANIHPSSVIAVVSKSGGTMQAVAKEVFAYTEASKNVSKGGSSTQKTGLKQNSSLRGVTLLDPLGLLLFGVHQLTTTSQGFMCDGWLPMTGNGSLLDDLERLKETLNASLLRAFEGLGAAMMAKSKQSSSHSGSRNGEYTATDEYEDSPEDVVQAVPLSERELDDLEELAKNVVETLKVHALDNGLPPTYDIARYLSSEDNYIAGQYPGRTRNSALGSHAQPKKIRESQTYGEWDAWGGNQASSGPKQSNVATTSAPLSTAPQRAQTNGAAPDHQQSMGAKSVVQPSETQDPWSGWQASATVNDSFDRRAALGQHSSASSSTFTNQRSPVPTQNQVIDAQPHNSALRTTVNTYRENPSPVQERATPQPPSPPPTAKANGWIGSKNVEALKGQIDDGWKDYSTAKVTFGQEDSDLSRGSAPTPQRLPAKILSVPTSSGPPMRNYTAEHSANTGWMPYDRYNPRTKVQQSTGRPTGPAHGSPSASMRMSSTSDNFPALAGSGNGDTSQPVEAEDGWGTWKPNRTGDGEQAFSNRAAMPQIAKASMLAPPGPIPPQVTATYTTSAYRQPENGFMSRSDTPKPILPQRTQAQALSNGYISPAAATNAPMTTPGNTGGDAWGSWAPAESVDKQGQDNYNRRVAMSKGQYVPPPAPPARPAPSAQVFSAQQVQSTTPLPPLQSAAPSAAPLAYNADDAWNSYQPSVPAHEEGNQAFERRKAMSSGMSSFSTDRSASSTSSTNIMYKTPSELRPQKTMSIVGRASRDANAREAVRGNVSLADRSRNTMSILQNGLEGLSIAGSARQSPAPSVSTRQQSPTNSFSTSSVSGWTAKQTSTPPSTLHKQALGAYSIPLRQPTGPSNSLTNPTNAFQHIARGNVLNTYPSSASTVASSDSGTYVSPYNSSRSGVPANAASIPDPVPAGGIGWD